MIHYVRKYVNQHFGSTIKMKIQANPNPTNSEMDSKTIIKQANLTRDQEREVYQQFVEIMVDGMDLKTLVAIVTDQLNDYYEDCSSVELKEDIDNYDEGLYNELVDNVTQQYPKPLNEFEKEKFIDINDTGGKF